MNDEQNIVYTQGRLLQAYITVEGMKAENQIRLHRGETPAYAEADFQEVIEEYGVHHNALLVNLTGH